MSAQAITRKLLAAGFVVGAALALAPSAFAQTTDTVDLSGTIAKTASVTATDTVAATALDLSSGAKVVKVSDINMTTNSASGVTLTVTSGNLTNGATGTIAYKVLTVGNGATAPASTDFATASGTTLTDTSVTTIGSSDRDLYINYTPTTYQESGTYNGSITLTVSAN